MAKPSRQGRQITVGTYKAGTNLSLTAVGTLLKKGVLGVVPVSAATDDAIGSLHQRVLGSDAGVDVPVQLLNLSQEIECVAHESLAVGDKVGPSATGRVQKAVAAGSLYVGTVETAGSAGDNIVVDVVDSRTRHA